MRCKALVDTVAGTLAEIGMQTLRETLVEVQAKALVDTLFETRQETITKVRSKTLIDRMPKRVSKGRSRQMVTHCQR